MIRFLLATSLPFLVLIAMPVALSAARYWQTANSEWWAADRSSARPHVRHDADQPSSDKVRQLTGDIKTVVAELDLVL